MNIVTTALALACLIGIQSPAHAVTATFDDLTTPPATDSATGLFFANADNAVYAGVTWESGLTVVGDGYRVDTATPGPLFGIPHSGRYFLTNQGDGGTNDGMLITTDMVLTGAWFGRNEYYGFGAGADQVTIHALLGSTVLASINFALPAPTVAGQPGVMGFADTGSFALLSGITGYRIDRRELGQLAGNWVADDFTFVAAAQVPEPQTYALLLAGLCVLAWARRRTLR